MGPGAGAPLSSSAQTARDVVAGRLRELRRGAGLTVTEHARQCGWHHAKTSRIENGRTAPSVTDIRRWCTVCGAESETEDLVARSLHADSLYIEWRRQVRQGLARFQSTSTERFRDTRLFRVYSSTIVPGLLQTEGYSAGILSLGARTHQLPADDSSEAARVRVERSRVIHEQGRRGVFVVEEAVLHHRVCGAEEMAAQLGYLLTTGVLPQVSLGVIPAGSSLRGQWPRETFHVYDDTFVSVELVSARLQISQPAEVVQYLRVFEALRAMAVYGTQARALIRRAIRRLGAVSS